MKKQFVADFIASLFILLFVYAALSKLLDYDEFRVQVSKSPLLTAYSGWVIWLVPAVEIAIALLLAIPRWRLPALYASFTLMVTFTAYIVAILHFSDFIPCSCGGILQNMSWNQHLVFNIVFIILALTGVLLYFSKYEQTGRQGRTNAVKRGSRKPVEKSRQH
jgi:uncharacterized membrane protein YphA (DoxX/SURF4 family)